MCGRADDDFGPAGWETLDWLFGVGQRRPRRPRRAEVRPTDPIMFIRPAAGGWDAPDGRWGLVPHGMTLEQARKYATFNARAETLTEKPMFRTASQLRLRSSYAPWGSGYPRATRLVVSTSSTSCGVPSYRSSSQSAAS